MHGWTDGRMEGWTDGCTDGWMNGRIDKLTDGHKNVLFLTFINVTHVTIMTFRYIVSETQTDLNEHIVTEICFLYIFLIFYYFTIDIVGGKIATKANNQILASAIFCLMFDRISSWQC